MSLRKFTTFAVDCDSDGCSGCYADVVEIEYAETVEAFALRDGWRRNEDGTHTCPGCLAAEAEKASGQVAGRT